MPVFTIQTNVSVAAHDKDFHATMTKLIADELKKPVEFIFVIVQDNQNMAYGGTLEPCAHVTLSSIGALGPDQNIKVTKRICHHLQEHLKIPSTRVFVVFTDVDAAWIGYDNTTFAEIL